MNRFANNLAPAALSPFIHSSFFTSIQTESTLLVGKVTEIVGRSNVGKTLLCYHMVAVLAIANQRVIVADCDSRWNVMKLKEIIVQYLRADMVHKSEWTNEMIEMETTKALKNIQI